MYIYLYLPALAVHESAVYKQLHSDHCHVDDWVSKEDEWEVECEEAQVDEGEPEGADPGFI